MLASALSVNRDYWNSLAASFDQDLLEIAEAGDGKVLREELEELSSSRGRVADLGCGPGSLLPVLAERFQEVLAVDYAEGLLEVARERCRAPNVDFQCHDLSRGQQLPFEVEVACCVNALIDPDRMKRAGMARSVASALGGDGAAVIVVPALESVFHVYHSLLRCRQREGPPAGLNESEADRLLQGEVVSFAGGVVEVGGVPTKYWMREELLEFLQEHGLVPQRVRRIEYGWGEEIDEPPSWLQKPWPWDWLVVARKRADCPREG